MNGDIESVKNILIQQDINIFKTNPRFLVELDLILFTCFLKNKQIESAIHLAQEKLLPVLDSQFSEVGLGLKIKVT